MLYIHKLSDLSPQTADVESVYLIRELKQKTPYPFNQQLLGDYFSDFSLSTTDKDAIDVALQLIDPAIIEMQNMLMERDPIHEEVNIQRAIQILMEIPPALRNNQAYVSEIMAGQDQFPAQITALFNKIPQLRGQEEKVACNTQVNQVFQKVLRHNQFGFHYSDIIHEGQVAQLTGLDEGMSKGFFFHISLEDELKKIDYNTLKSKLPEEKVAEVERLRENIVLIRKGVERAYQANMRMVNTALVLYAYVKWLTNR